MVWNVNHAWRILFVTTVLVLLILGFYNLPYYPVVWFDEGLAVQGALNLANHGEYAMRSSEGFRVLDQPLIANGPGLVMPTALVFKVFGAGLLQARGVVVVCFVLVVLAFFQTARRFSGLPAALISSMLLLAVPNEGILFYGRQALGNVPALLYFLIGLRFLFHTEDGNRLLRALLAGLFLGLALITKGQYWIFVPVFGLIMLVDHAYYKQVGLKHMAVTLCIMLFCAGTWFLAQYTLVGAENFEQHLAALDSSTKVTILAFRAVRIPGNIGYLVRSGFVFFVLPGVCLALFKSRERSMAGFGRLLLAVFALVWMLWFTFASVGWPRYMFEAYSIGLLLSGEVFQRLFVFARGNRREAGVDSPQTILLYRRGASLALIALLAWAVSGLFNQVRNIDARYDDSPQKFADAVNQTVPVGAVIESWEWEIDLLAPDRVYHHPTNDWVDWKTAETQFGEAPSGPYDALAYQPEYLIEGPFSKWTEMYADLLAGGCCEPVVTIGNYTLFKIKPQK
jgi:4-amino-4-deoxy-L-arabinose transferase-like glycosyltransferase